jgi:hypothetical protein
LVISLDSREILFASTIVLVGAIGGVAFSAIVARRLKRAITQSGYFFVYPCYLACLVILGVSAFGMPEILGHGRVLVGIFPTCLLLVELHYRVERGLYAWILIRRVPTSRNRGLSIEVAQRHAKVYATIFNLAAVGALEEVLFRGLYPIAGAEMFGSSELWLLLGVVGYGLVHSFFGFREFVAKSTLGLLLAATTYIGEGVLPALMAHIYYNMRVSQGLKLSHA